MSANHATIISSLAEALSRKMSLVKFEYRWVVSEAVLLSLPGGFTRPSESHAETNVELRQHLHNLWLESSFPERVKLADWVINRWGGIKSNKASTLERYAKDASADDPQTNFHGISSYSKVLSVADPERFAIYDSRVATALNGLQLLAKCHIVAFPCPPGRNRAIHSSAKTGFSNVFTTRRLSSLGFATVPRDVTYGMFVALLKDLANRTGRSILDLEMQLFSGAVEISRQANRLALNEPA